MHMLLWEAGPAVEGLGRARKTVSVNMRIVDIHAL